MSKLSQHAKERLAERHGERANTALLHQLKSRMGQKQGPECYIECINSDREVWSAVVDEQRYRYVYSRETDTIITFLPVLFSRQDEEVLTSIAREFVPITSIPATSRPFFDAPVSGWNDLPKGRFHRAIEENVKRGYLSSLAVRISSKSDLTQVEKAHAASAMSDAETYATLDTAERRKKPGDRAYVTEAVKRTWARIEWLLKSYRSHYGEPIHSGPTLAVPIAHLRYGDTKSSPVSFSSDTYYSMAF